MNILVTKGADYIGSVLTPALLTAGHRVTVLDNFRYNQNSLSQCCISDNFNVVRGDVRDERILSSVLTSADAIIPLAALVGYKICDNEESTAVSTNYDAVKSICELASPQQIIVFPNTNSGYGICTKEEVCTEDTPMNPISLYGRTKAAAEQIVLSRENSIAFRLATVFGMSPRMRIDLLVNDLVYRAVNDSSVVLFEAHAKRNYIHIRDVARAFLHALTHFDTMKSNVYNLGLSNANLSKLELCEEIYKQLPNFSFVSSDYTGDPDKRDYIVSNEKIEKTGFVPTYTLTDGIRELIKGYTILKNFRYGNA